MKAVVARAFGPPDGFALEQRPTPAPGPGEVLVQAHWAGVSFVDVLTAAGRYQHRPPLPFVPGSELSGRVLQVGAGVAGVRPGDPVCGGGMGGMLAQHVVLPASRLQVLGGGDRLPQAAVLRASYLTASYALHQCGRLRDGETLLVLGAAGAVGVAACQLGALAGATVIASASSAAKRAFALENGARHAVDGGAADWREQVRALCGGGSSGGGPDLVLDPVGGGQSERALRALGPGGRHLVVGFASGQIPRIPLNLPLLKGVSVIGVLASHFVEREPERAQATRTELLRLFERGEIAPQVGQRFPLHRFVDAMRAASEGAAPGRVLIDMRDGGDGTNAEETPTP